MDTFLNDNKEEKRGVNKVMLAAVAVAALIIAGAVGLLTLLPDSSQQKQQEMEGAFLEGNPEFESYTNQLIVTTNFDRTSESPLGIGTIQMSIHGDIRNKGTRVINGLEVRVSVVDLKNQVVKEKKMMVVPNQAPTLSPNETIKVFVSLGGFTKEDDRANVRWKVTAIRFQ